MNERALTGAFLYSKTIVLLQQRKLGHSLCPWVSEGCTDPGHLNTGGKEHDVPWRASLYTLFSFIPLRSMVDFTEPDSVGCCSWDTLTQEQAEHAVARDLCEKRGPWTQAAYSSAAGRPMGRDIWAFHRPTHLTKFWANADVISQWTDIWCLYPAEIWSVTESISNACIHHQHRETTKK